MMNKNKQKSKKKMLITPQMASPFDPLGSWTGNYLSYGLFYDYEEPVQDVDDL